MKKSGSIPRSSIIKMIVTVTIPIAILFIPESELFNTQLKTFLAITVFAILTFAFENFNTLLISLALPFAYTLFKVAPPEVVFQSWSSNVVWMVLGGLMLAQIVDKTGLLKRIAYKCIIITGGTYRGVIIGLALAGIIMTVLLAGNGIIPMAALSYGICIALGYKEVKESCGIMLAATFGCTVSTAFIFTAGPVMYASFASRVMDLTWIEFFTKQAVGVVYFILVIVMLYLYCRPKEDTVQKEYFLTQFEALGKWSIAEKKAAGICLFLLGFLLTGNLHHIPLMWGFAIVPLIAYMPGINIIKDEDIKNLNFTMVFFTAGCMAIGIVGSSLGIGQIVSGIAMPIFEGKSISIILFMIYILFVVLNFVMTPLAIAAAFTLPFTEIMIDLGINPDAFYLFETITLDQVFLPYEFVMYLVVFSFGMIKINDFIKVMTMRFIIATAYIFILLIPYWELIGFLRI